LVVLLYYWKRKKVKEAQNPTHYHALIPRPSPVNGRRMIHWVLSVNPLSPFVGEGNGAFSFQLTAGC
jgi:hypothetical protein